MKNKILLTLFFGLCSMVSYSQEKGSVSGTVSDYETGETIPGATILVKGSGSNGTVTDFDGNYRLSGIKPTDILTYSFIGYTPVEIEIGNQSIIDVQLDLNVTALEEIVVIGYGTQKKKVVTGAIESISAKEITALPVVRVDQALQGRAAGVQVLNQSGQPGEPPAIRIRGIGTDGDSGPLILVDGIAVNSIDNLNPSDIKSMEVLKDAASTSIYGARAANGVVLITTKTGSKGKLTANYTGFVGVQNAAKKVDLLNSNEYIELMSAAGARSLEGVDFDPNMVAANNTDWQEALFTDNAPIESHYIGIDGGSEKSNYAASVSYFNQEGIIGGDKSKFERYTARLNTRTQLNDVFTFGNMLSYTHLQTRGVTSNGSFNGAYSSALNLDPLTSTYETDADNLLLPPYSNNPVLRNSNGQYYAISENVGGEVVNPLARLELQNQVVTKDQVLGSIFAQMEPIKGLQIKTSVGLDLNYLDFSSFRDIYYLTETFNNTAATSVSKQIQKSSVFQLENTANYSKRIGPHNFNFLVGTTLLDNRFENLGGGGQGINTKNPNLIYLDLGVDSTQTSFGGANRVTRSSLFSRLLYDYNDRVSLSVTQRRDGSSNFGNNNKWANFFSFGASWVINEEPFFPKISFLSLLKLRASWGQNGNDRIDQFLYESLVDFNVAYILNTGAVNGAIPQFLANQDIKWEASQQIDFGLETGFFENKLTATLDYYKKTTKDLLQGRTPPATVGQDLRVSNIGEMVNEGFEISATWRDDIKDLSYSISANATYNKNTMTRVASEAGFIEGASWALAGEVTRTIEGESVVSFYGFKTDGIFQNSSDVFGYINASGDPIQPNAAPGDIKFVDVDGDGRITDADRTVIGSPLPDWTLGSNLSLSYKSFDFSALIIGQVGLEIFNGMNRPDILTSNRQSWIMDRWTEENPSNEVPRFVAGDGNENYTRATDMLNIENGSYVRLKNIQFGYRLPSDFLERIKCSNWRVYISAENLLTITGYSGADPEVGSTSTDGRINIRDTGIDRGIYPQSRTFRFGTSVTF
ncbi:MAG: TonB-linked SusC/RagA family outer membrane protein [Cyclobacteriaceae bacterium]|jgi:TonB-linked SusC/RagA family outer membrane protein